MQEERWRKGHKILKGGKFGLASGIKDGSLRGATRSTRKGMQGKESVACEWKVLERTNELFERE